MHFASLTADEGIRKQEIRLQQETVRLGELVKKGLFVHKKDKARKGKTLLRRDFLSHLQE